MFYGLTNQRQAFEIAQAVCDVLGHGSNGKAVALLVETAQQETHLGTYRDRSPYRHGTGLCQVDPIGLQDVKTRTRPHNVELIDEKFGIELSLVTHRDLEHSPLLAFVICRLHYKLRPEIIPPSVEGRGAYWKEFYNTKAGRGTVHEYLDNAKRIVDDTGIYQP